jgi:hypothetical protein
MSLMAPSWHTCNDSVGALRFFFRFLVVRSNNLFFRKNLGESFCRLDAAST